MIVKVIKQAENHIRFRWVGVPFLIIGVVLLFTAVQQYFRTGSFFPVLLGVACSLMGLTCFGVNHDTAICLAMQAHREDNTLKLSEQLQREMEDELARDRSKALSLQSNPIIAMILPIIVCIVVGIEIYMLFGK